MQRHVSAFARWELDCDLAVRKRVATRRLRRQGDARPSRFKLECDFRMLAIAIAQADSVILVQGEEGSARASRWKHAQMPRRLVVQLLHRDTAGHGDHRPGGREEGNAIEWSGRDRFRTSRVIRTAVKVVPAFDAS